MPMPVNAARAATGFRKLAAIDIVFLGYKLIFAEYAVGVFFSIALGLFVLVRGSTFLQVVLGAYLICLGINYVPMLAYAVAIGSQSSAQAELGDELTERRRAMSKYRRQSLFLLVPLLVPILAATQVRIPQKGAGEWWKRPARHFPLLDRSG
ncbi:MAG TPA: hypothetical protein VL523_08190 [Terriglobia bacterium]|nr:hypothetical protein [Terriglobia bacterium]